MDADDALQQTLPIFPLGTVLFPGGELVLRIFEPRYVAMVRRSLAGNTPFGICLIRAGFEVGTAAIPHDIGCTARISRWEEPAEDRFLIRVRGENRFRIATRDVAGDGLISARVTLLEPPDPLPLPARFAPLRAMLEDAIERVGAEHFPAPQRLDDADWVACRIAEHLPITPERRQQLLEQDEPMQRLETIARILAELRDPPEA
jgi:hypothetical protein